MLLRLCELAVAQPLTKAQEQESSSTEAQDHSWKMSESRDKVKKLQENLKSIHSATSAFISPESWRAIEARLRSVVQKGEQDHYSSAYEGQL